MSATILVMDDDAYMRELLGLHLGAAGYEVLLAEDAVVAGRILLSQRVDLLIADVELPYMDGLEFVQAVKSDPAVSWIPVVFVTSHGQHEVRAMELGAVAYLRKPVRADELLDIIAKHLESRHRLIA